MDSTLLTLSRLNRDLRAQFPQVVGVSAHAPSEAAAIMGEFVVAVVGGQEFRIDLSEAVADESELIAAAEAWEEAGDPDWRAFVDRLASISGFYAAIAESSLSFILSARMVRLAAGEEFKGSADPLISVWNAAAPGLSQTQRDALSAAAGECTIPLEIAADNTLSAT